LICLWYKAGKERMPSPSRPPEPIPSPDKPQLLRRLNLLDTTFLVIGAVVGSGIFMTSGYILEYVSSPGWLLLVWLVGGLFTLGGALSCAELGAMFPRAGGQYVYIREAYGSFAGYLYGWGFFWFIGGGGIAALAVGFAEFFGYFVPGLSTQSLLLKTTVFGHPYTLSAGQLLAAATIIFLTGVNYFGVKSGAIVQDIFTFLRIGSVLALVILGLTVGKRAGISSVHDLFRGGPDFGPHAVSLFGLALIAALWTYDGWYAVNCTAEEIKKPERNIPRGLVLGTLSITLIYVLLNFVYILALPVDRMRGIARVGELASSQLFGPTATSIISGAITVSIFGCLSANILFCPRVYLAMAEDKIFFRSMSYIHPRFHVPSKALIGQAVWSCLLCLSGTYKDLYEFVVFALVIFFGATGLAVIVLRRTRPHLPRPYRAWGYPVVPLLFALINLFIFLNTVISAPQKSLFGLLLLGLGVPAYFYWRRKARTDASLKKGAA
jgi:APA family basic amino acid/polyamine antiporter